MRNQLTQLRKAFTLVELIVVVTILSILSTIGFVSYSSYLSGVRDTNRISQLKAIGDSLHLYETKKSLPLPDEKRLEIKDGATTIAIQGYVGKSVIETIGYTSEGKDPKDNTYFSYYLTKDRKYFQLLAFLEDQPETTSKLNNLNKLKKLNNLKTTQAIDYENRYSYVEGKKLGILTTDSNEPIQEVQSGSLDISNVGTSKTYKSYLKSKEVIIGNGTTFKDLGKVAKSGGRGYSASGNTLVYTNFEGKESNVPSDFEKTWGTDNIHGTFTWIAPFSGNIEYVIAGSSGGAHGSGINGFDGGLTSFNGIYILGGKGGVIYSGGGGGYAKGGNSINGGLGGAGGGFTGSGGYGTYNYPAYGTTYGYVKGAPKPIKGTLYVVQGSSYSIIIGKGGIGGNQSGKSGAVRISHPNLY